ncbi:MAG TPA: CPBP family intramembrane glutamic endopeptidase [Chryseosolibacter sp.]|nr:CPBP family intramembrane glutamic endopeptidase [Chryseosolibacter sp.]
MKALIRRYPLVTYFALAYSIAWGPIFLINYFAPDDVFQGEGVLSEGIRGPVLLMWLAMIIAPPVAGLLMTAIVEGKTGLKKLFQSMVRWKVNPRWYLSLLIFPALLVPILYALVAVSPNYTPGLMVVGGIVAGFVGGSLEEVGWTGFALKRLQLKYTPFFASVILGFVHTLWHFYPDYLGGIDFYEEFYFLHFLLWIVGLIAFRFIAVWIYNHANSLLLAQLAHASFTGSQLVFGPPSVTAEQSVLWYALFITGLCVVAAVIIVSDENLFFESGPGRPHQKGVAFGTG